MGWGLIDFFSLSHSTSLSVALQSSHPTGDFDVMWTIERVFISQMKKTIENDKLCF